MKYDLVKSFWVIFGCIFGLILLGMITSHVTPPATQQSVNTTFSPPEDFRGLKWRSKPVGGLGKHAHISTDDMDTYSKSGNVADFMDVPVAEEMYNYSYKQFYQGLVFLNGQNNYNKIRSALIARYGRPNIENEKLHLSKWDWPDQKIIIQLSYQSKFAQTTVVMGRSD